VLVAPSGARAASFVVDDVGEAPDADTGDGLCATATPKCTLRAALEQAIALGGAGHTITLPAGTYIQSTTLPTVVVGVTIAGAGAPTTVVQSSNTGHPRLFLVDDGGALVLADLTLTGASIVPGAAVYGIGGAVTLFALARRLGAKPEHAIYPAVFFLFSRPILEQLVGEQTVLGNHQMG
jgi:hypothetical protein